MCDSWFWFLVAKRKSLFDDKAVEIEELTYIIKQVSLIVSMSINVAFFVLYLWMYHWSVIL